MSWLDVILLLGSGFCFGYAWAVPEGEQNAYRRGYEAGRRRADNESTGEQP